MGKSFFIWNGKDCRSMGVTLEGPPPIVRGEERVKHVTIPGRAGELTQTEGECIYQGYIQNVTIQVRGSYRVREIQNWLKGSGEVTFCGEPDRKQKARVIGAVTLDRHSRNLDVRVGEVQFYCEPLKEKLSSDLSTITSSGSTVRNNGDTVSRPMITMTASSTSATIVSGGKTLTITGLTSNNDYVIDSDAEIITNANGSTNLTANSSGGFPLLNVGNNTVTGSGWSKLVIDRKERFL